MANAIIKDNYLEYNNQRYFRSNAESLFVGSFGEKRMPVLSSAYLDEQGRVPVVSFRVANPVVVSINFDESDNRVVESFRESIQNNKHVLLKVEVETGSLISLFEEDEDIVGRFTGLEHPRLVHQIFTLVEASSDHHYLISKGTVIAYGLTEPQFNSERNKIVGFKNDQKGPS